MTPKSAAYTLGVSVDTIYLWIHTGKLLAYQPGGPRCSLLVPYNAVCALRDRHAQVKPLAIRSQQIPEKLG